MYKPKHPSAKLPKQALKGKALVYLLYAVSVATARLWCFFTEQINVAVADGAIITAVIMLLLYKLGPLVTAAIASFSTSASLNNDELLQAELNEKAITAAMKVSGKVIVDEKALDNSTVITSISNYVSKYRKLWDAVVKFAIGLLMFVISIGKTIQMAASSFGSPLMFAVTILLVVAANIFLAYRTCKVAQASYGKVMPLVRLKEARKNACLNMRIVCEEHFSFMKNKYTQTVHEIFLEEKKQNKRRGRMSIASSAVSTFAVVVIVVEAVITIGVKNLDLIKLTQLMTTTAVVASVIDGITSQITGYQYIVSLKNEVSQEAPLFEEIMKVCDSQKEEETVESIKLKPFNFSYGTTGFCLKSSKALSLKKGEMVLLRGDSGAGKSTLLQLLAGELGDNPKVKSIRYSSEASLGCESLLEEITFGEVDPERLICILKGVQIYDLLCQKAEAEGEELLSYLSKVRGGLSTGMQDRVMLARTLYNMDNSSLVLIDEPIGGVDFTTAKKIIGFIKNYAARQMDKPVVVTTHQFQQVQNLFDRIIDVKREGSESIVV